MPDFSFNVQYPQQQQMSLGDMLNLARGAQAYQQAQQLNPVQLETARLEQQTKQQALNQAQQLNPVELAKAKEELSQKGMTTEKQRSELKGYYTDQARKAYGGLLTDPDFDPRSPNVDGIKAKLEETKDYLKNVVGLPEHDSNMHDKLIKHIEDHGEVGAQRVIQTIRNGIQQGQTLATQGQELNANPQFVSTGQYQVPVYTSPYQGGGPGRTPAVKQQLAPGSVESIDTDPITNAKVIVTKDPNGQIIGSRPAGQQNPMSGFTNLPPGETKTSFDQAKELVTNASNTSIPAQNSIFNSNKIVDLADKAFTGVGADVLSKLGGGYAALPWTSDSTTNMQILGHQMALETANLAGASGLGTDAARGLAAQMAGTTNWTPDAIKATARMNRALSTGTLLFNQGVDAAVKANNGNPFAAREFQKQWGNTPNLVPTLQFIDAYKNKDNDELRQIVESVGGLGSKGYTQLLQSAQGIKSLIGGK